MHGDAYTTEELTGEALARGYRDVSKRLIYDWSSLGLLDSPTLYSPGRRGRPDAFPDSQRQLFLVLLEQRKRRTKQILGLCNVPVFVWLWWGDDYIPLRQVRRALKTWGRACLADSVVGAQRAATQLLRQMNLPRYARGRMALKLALARVIVEISAGKDPDHVDWGDVEAKLLRVWSVDGTGKPRGPTGAQTTPHMIITMLQDRYRTVVRLDEFDNFLFEWARWVYRTTSREYHLHSRDYARDPALGHLHRETSTVEHIANHACLDLLSTLGSAHLVHSDEILWNPDTWRSYCLRSTTAGEVTTAGGVIVPLRT